METNESEAKIRLNKYLAEHGVASRRRCDELIAAGKVTVDGEITTELGTKVDPTRQRVEIDGHVLKAEDVTRQYYLLNKPSGVVCTNDEREFRPRAVDLITARGKGRIYTVGRLDEETVGLVILTSDGDFANMVMHPRYGVPKTYVVKVAGRIDDASVQQVRDGVRLSEGKTGGARVLVQKRSPHLSTLVVTLNEGKNREVRRVFASLGWKVISLRRTRIGTLSDRGLKVGHWRPLTRKEVQDLLAPPRASGRRSAKGSVASGRGTRGPDAAAAPTRASTIRPVARRESESPELPASSKSVDARRPRRTRAAPHQSPKSPESPKPFKAPKSPKSPRFPKSLESNGRGRRP